MRKLLIFLLLILSATVTYCQVIVIPIYMSEDMVPEHGFLPGKAFRFYKTTVDYSFGGRRLKVNLVDDRARLNLEKIECSALPFTNTSEFSKPEAVYKVRDYIDSLFSQSGIIIDTSAKDILNVSLQALDVRLIGFGSVRVHGMCQMEFNYQGKSAVYCTDITDADPNSPVRPTAWVTRKTATRILASAAVREVIEQFLKDLSEL